MTDSNGTVEVALAVASCRYRVMLAMAMPRRRWSWRDVAVESC
jgi:hypothetical protein